MPEEPKDSETKKKLEKSLSELESGTLPGPKKSIPKSDVAENSSRTWLQEKPQSKHKRLFVGAVVALGVTVVGLTSWLAYALWYQNPEKVVMDAMVNALTAKTVKFSGTSSNEVDQTSVKVTFDGQWGYKEGGSGNMQLAYKAEKGDEVKFDVSGITSVDRENFLKINNTQELYDVTIESMDLRRGAQGSANQAQLSNIINLLLRPIVQKIDGKWIKFNINDVKKISATQAEQYECAMDVLDKLQSDSGLLGDIGQAYSKDRFIEVRRSIGSSDGSLGFAVGLKKDALERFAQSLKQTKLYKEFQKCSPLGTNPLAIDVSKFPDTSPSSKFEVWVDQWSHRLTKIKFEDSRLEATRRVTDKFELLTSFNTSVKVEIPTKDIVTFDEALSGVDAFISRTLEGAMKQQR